MVRVGGGGGDLGEFSFVFLSCPGDEGGVFFDPLDESALAAATTASISEISEARFFFCSEVVDFCRLRRGVFVEEIDSEEDFSLFWLLSLKDDRVGFAPLLSL